MRLVDEGVLRLDDRVGEWLSDWKGKDRDHVTLRDLLAHCSGLSAHLPLYESYSGRTEFQRVICGLMLEYTPRTQSIYSDMGFMLLGWIARRRRRRVALRTARAASRSGSRRSSSNSRRRARWRPDIAPTEIDTWRGRLLIGEVHDPNCWALNGEAGHAGLFGIGVGRGGFARLVLRGLTQRDGRAGEARDDPDVRAAHDRYPRQHARARLGHDETDVVVRLAHEPDGDRSHRLYRHVAVDRLGARPVRGAADQPRPSDRREQRHPAGASGVSRRGRRAPGTMAAAPARARSSAMRVQSSASNCSGAMYTGYRVTLLLLCTAFVSVGLVVAAARPGAAGARASDRQVARAARHAVHRAVRRRPARAVAERHPRGSLRPPHRPGDLPRRCSACRRW